MKAAMDAKLAERHRDCHFGRHYPGLLGWQTFGVLFFQL